LGCKGKYSEWITEDGIKRITEWFEQGYTDREICRMIGIHYSAWYDWLKRFPQLADAKKNARSGIAETIEKSFYSRCMVQTYEETKVEKIIRMGAVIEERHTTTTKVMPPSDALVIFALKNLMPDKYRDRPQVVDVSAQEKHTALVNAIKQAVTDD